MSRKQKKILLRIIISTILLIIACFLPVTGYWRLLIFLIPYAVIGWDVLWKAIRNIAHGQIFDENFLMALATVGAFCIGEYPEGCIVVLFYQIGELFQSYAVGRSRRSISELMDIRPDYANVERNGEVLTVAPDEVSIGEIIYVKPGEKIPLDGTITEGKSTLNTAALTGESLPRDVKEGDSVISGCINQSGLLKICVAKEFGESTVSKILELVENSSTKKSRTENFITRFARYYTPAVVIAALLLAIIPPLFLQLAWSDWVYRALIFLVISCPCALVISVPLSFFGGIGGASRLGVLIKGGNYLEALAHADTFVFDKTGTLTEGVFEVTEIHSENGCSESDLLELAALSESYSDHPIAISLKKAYAKDIDTSRVSEIKEIAGHGISATIDGKSVSVGNEKLMNSLNLRPHTENQTGTIVYVAQNGLYCGYIIISDRVRADAKSALAQLKSAGISKTVMLTGDARAAAHTVANNLLVSEYHAELLPGDKVEQVERLLAAEDKKGSLVFVGDGINDAPVLSRADVGIAMGGLGSDAAVEAADIVLMDDKLSKLPLAVTIARKTIAIAKQNISFALAVKALVLILGACGAANMWEAVFADVGVSVIAILNAMRTLRLK